MSYKIILIIFLILITGCTKETVELTQETCETAGGTWDSCGSACRGQEGAFCIEVCVEYCECRHNTDCPGNYLCKDYIDKVGICK